MTPEFTGGGEPRISLQLLWKRRERPARGPKPGLTVDAIVRAAIAIADAEGLEAVSMRRVAQELGAGTMSLYRHVPGKAELLELMLDAVIGEEPAPDPLPEGWRARLELFARDQLAGYRRHPWMLGVSMVRPPLGPNIIGGTEMMLAAVEETGLPPRERLAAVSLVTSYVLGAAQPLVQAAQAEAASGESTEDWWRRRTIFWEEFFVPDDHPAITRLWEEGGFAGEQDALFEWGLQRVLDGIQARIDAMAG